MALDASKPHDVPAGRPTTTTQNEVSGKWDSITQRIPDFWQDQPKLWFIQVEAILATQKNSSEN